MSQSSYTCPINSRVLVSGIQRHRTLHRCQKLLACYIICTMRSHVCSCNRLDATLYECLYLYCRKIARNATVLAQPAQLRSMFLCQDNARLQAVVQSLQQSKANAERTAAELQHSNNSLSDQISALKQERQQLQEDVSITAQQSQVSRS